MVAVFVRDENSGEIFRCASDAGEARSDLACGKSCVNQDAAIFSFDVGAITAGTAAKDGEFDGHEWDNNCPRRIGQIFSRTKFDIWHNCCDNLGSESVFQREIATIVFCSGHEFLAFVRWCFSICRR